MDVLYARCGEAHIAYQVLGDGPIDLVHVPGFVSHLDAHELKGVPGEWRLSSVRSSRSAAGTPTP